MTVIPRASHARQSNDPVIDWLLDTDPSLRWQVMRDLTDAPAELVAAERSRVASEGWGPRLLEQQRPDGQWGDGVATPFWWSNLYTLLFLRDLGLDPASAPARAAIALVRDNVTWGPEWGNAPFFEGEVEPCINGRVVALGAYFGERSDRLVDRLLGEQLADGGWNCEAERGSVRSSFHTTICVLEGLLAFEQAFGATRGVTAVTDARRRDHRARVDAARVSDALALRRASRARLPARGRRAGRRASRRGGGDRAPAAWRRRALVARRSTPRHPSRGVRRRRRSAESLDHVARAASARLACPSGDVSRAMITGGVGC